MRARIKPSNGPPSSAQRDEMLAQALASAQVVTTRAAAYAQQLTAALPPSPVAEPVAEPVADSSATANAMTQEVFGRLRERSQRIVENLHETEKRIAAGYDRVAQSLIARTTALTQAIVAEKPPHSSAPAVIPPGVSTTTPIEPAPPAAIHGRRDDRAPDAGGSRAERTIK
jgi:hypothetical protein